MSAEIPATLQNKTASRDRLAEQKTGGFTDDFFQRVISAAGAARNARKGLVLRQPGQFSQLVLLLKLLAELARVQVVVVPALARERP